jgi:transposase
VKLPDGPVGLAEPGWFGKLPHIALLFEALILAMAQQITYAAVADLAHLPRHHLYAICSRYVDMALEAADPPAPRPPLTRWMGSTDV